MLYLSTISTTALELLKVLMSLNELSGLRLVGGTALALQIGHRKSIDLDLFGKVDFVNYSYPWLQDKVVAEGIRLAREQDMAPYMLTAIEWDEVKNTITGEVVAYTERHM